MNAKNIVQCLIMTTLVGCYNTEKETVFVNPIKLVDQYKHSAIKRQALQKQLGVWQANVDSLAREMETTASRNKSVKAEQLVQYRQAVQQKALAEQSRINQEILTEVNTYVKEYGRTHGYQFILGATETGNIVYAAEGTDVTDDVLKGLNQQYDRQHPQPKLP